MNTDIEEEKIMTNKFGGFFDENAFLVFKNQYKRRMAEPRGSAIFYANI